MGKIKVLLIEDQTLTRIGIKTILEKSADIEVIGEAASLQEGLNLSGQLKPDVTLLSLRFSDVCAVNFINDFLEVRPENKIIILAAQAGDVEINRSLKRGAFGYVLKDVSANELIQAIQTVKSGKKYVPANIAKILSENFGSEELTQSEQRILEMIVDGNSNKEIAAQLNVTENTVKTHVKNILAKLGVDDRTAAATSAIRRGLVRVDV